MSLSFIFSTDSRMMFACFLKTVTRLSYDIRTGVAKIHQNFTATASRQLHERLTSVQEYFCEKNRVKFLNMFKTFATISRHTKSLATLVCRAKVPRLNSQNSREEFACQ